ncbi:hypothetical protein MATL_G00019930 [Megalops atlanticus]|uniref:Bcl-x interacting BH3 domain-containing protein n=1 Tax=Megalops atlanticus TaxID=7932 RepID=A0A9D3QIT0_MEGAT|nr:hypothetical protein MATL_G00019930 [Megalops atlanticus]
MPQDPGRPIRSRSLSMPADVRPEVWVGQELRRIGDEVNRMHVHRGRRNRNGQRARSECVFCLWMAFLVGLLIQTILRRR